jgi:uncharacterized damage-inducible protein DinB
MIKSVESYIRYFEGIRRRTLTFAQAIPPDKIDWAPAVGEFSFGDILRHLAAIEAITTHAVVKGAWRAYPGHDPGPAGDLDEIITLLEDTHAKAIEMLRDLPDVELGQPRPAITGEPTKAWVLLMAIIEHEIHHRSQLASYLNLFDIEPPQIYGLGVEDVATLSAQQAENNRETKS